MISIPENNTITTNDEFMLPAGRPGGVVLIDLSGNFGGGTAALGFKGGDGLFTAFKDAAGDAVTATGRDAWAFDVPKSGVVVVKLTGATAPALVVSAVESKAPLY